MGIVSIIIWIVAIVCAVWVILDIWTKQKKMEQTHKIIWTVAAVIFSIITAIVYYFMIKSK
ncbi:MAG: PLDc N-terminal domain-containing protein [Candidatus Nanoarchaeia archaeon]